MHRKAEEDGKNLKAGKIKLLINQQSIIFSFLITKFWSPLQLLISSKNFYSLHEILLCNQQARVYVNFAMIRKSKNGLEIFITRNV
jgi:hypothetical protein